MAEKIRIEIDDATKSGAASVNATLDTMSQHGAKAEKSFDLLNEAMSDAYKFKANKVYHGVAQEIDEVDKASTKAAASTGGWLKAAVGIFALKETFSKVYQGINMLAQGGSESMQALITSFETLKKAAVSFTNDATVAKWISAAASGVNTLAAGLAAIPDKFRETQDTIARTITLTGEWFGLLAKGSTETVAGMQRMRIESARLDKQHTETSMRWTKFYAILRGEEQRNADLRQAQVLNEITDQGKLDGLRAQAYRELKALGEAEVLNQEKIAAATAKYAAANDRARLNQAETARKVAEQNAEVKAKKEREAADQEKKNAADVAAVEAYWGEVRAARAKMLIDKMYAQEEAAADARIRLAEQEAAARKAAFDKASQNQQGNIKAIAGSITPQQIARQIADQRGAAAAQAERERFRKANASKIKPAIAAGNKSKEFRDLLRKQEAAATKARRDAEANARRDIRRGNIGQNEALGAQKELVDKIVDKGQAQGTLSKEAATVLKDATKVLVEQQREINQALQEVRQAQGALNQLMGRGMNATDRAQRAARP